MEAKEYLRFLVEEIHTVVAATTDEKGLPVTCAIDMMDWDQNGLYFLTAKGKGFYRRLQSHPFLALTGVKGDSTMTRAALSIRGKVRPLGEQAVQRLLEKNPYMYEIYPTQVSREAICVFCLYQGTGEWFDLSKKPIQRDSFWFGEAQPSVQGYRITQGCTGCKACLARCPQGCIDVSTVPAVIRQEHCLRCGNCLEICPAGAVIREG